MKTNSKTKENFIKFIPSKVTEIYHTEVEYINKDLHEKSHKLYKQLLKLIEEGKLDGIIYSPKNY